MAGLIRSLFKGKKSSRKENKDPGVGDDEYYAFQPCPSAMTSSDAFKQPHRPRTARFADDTDMLPATAAYHTVGAPRLRKGPQSCPGGAREDIARSRSLSRKASDRRNFDIDNGGVALERRRSQRDAKPHHGSLRHGRSHYSLYDAPNRSDSDEENQHPDIERFERKSAYYMRKFEESERQRKEERRRQERLEHEKNSIQTAMSNLTYCTTVQQMASAQQMEQLKRERDQFKKELGKYKTRYEKLENKFERLETKNTMSPSYGAFQAPFPPMQPSPMYAQFAPPAPHSFNFPAPNPRHPLNPLHRSMDFVNHQKPPRGDFPSLLMTNSTSSSGQHSGSTSFAASHTPTTTSDGAGEALVNPMELSFMRSTSAGGKAVNFLSDNYDDEDDEIKNYRHHDQFSMRSPPFSEMTESSSAMTSKTH